MLNSSLRPKTKFLARPADTTMPNAKASFNSAEVAPTSFAPAKALRSQVGQLATTAHPTWMSLRVFTSSTSSYSNIDLYLFSRHHVFSSSAAEGLGAMRRRITP